MAEAGEKDRDEQPSEKTDIRPRARAEVGLYHSESLLRSIVESAPNPIAISDREGKLLFINKVGPGLRLEDTIGLPAWQFLIPEDQPKAQACLAQVFTTRQPGVYEATGRSGRRWLVHVGPRYEGDEIIGAIWVAWDVTEQRELEWRVAIADRMAS